MLRSMQADREAEFMTRREVMAALSLGRAAYQRMVKDGIIPEFQPSGRGGKAYVRRCDLEQLKAEGIL